jgi:hypothetical protein
VPLGVAVCEAETLADEECDGVTLGDADCVAEAEPVDEAVDEVVDDFEPEGDAALPEDDGDEDAFEGGDDGLGSTSGHSITKLTPSLSFPT